MRQLKEKTNLLVLLLTIFSLSFCTALDEATTTEDSASVGTSGASNLSADCTAASATSVYTIFSDIDGAQDTPDSATWEPAFGSGDSKVELADGSGPKCGNVAAKITRESTSAGWLAGSVANPDNGQDWSSYDTLKVWVKADSSSYTTHGLKFKLSDTSTDNENGDPNGQNKGDTAELSVDNYGFTADGTWKLVKIPIADFASGLDKANIDDFVWIGNALSAGQVVYFDEIYVDASGETTYSVTASGCAASTCGIWTEAITPDTLAVTAVINSSAWGGGDTPTDQASTDVTPTEGSKVVKITYNLGGDWAGQGGSVINWESSPVNIAGENLYLYLDIDNTTAMSSFDNMGIKFDDTGGGNKEVFLKSYTATSTSGSWKSYKIPLSDFTGVDFSTIKSLGFWGPTDVGGTKLSGSIYLDNVKIGS